MKIRLLNIILLAALWVGTCSIGWAETSAAPSASETLAETRTLLQKGLDLHEIDRELARIGKSQTQTSARIAEIEQSLEVQYETTDKRKEQAGRVLRSYYMGKRDALYLPLLKMDSLTDALAALDFIQMIFRHDQVILASYRDSIRSLESTHSELLTLQEELASVEQAFIAQREKQVQLAAELEEELAAIPASAQIMEEIEQLTTSWEEQGLPLFRQYFSSLAKTMQQLPEMITTDEKHLTIRGSNILFQLSDEDLNTFIHSKDATLGNLSFRFAGGIISAEGTEANIEIAMTGQYTLEQEPKNSIRFHVNTITFNGFDLPETTVRALEEEFDLSIYPEKFKLKVEATSVKMKENLLQIQLRTKGNWLDSILGGWLS